MYWAFSILFAIGIGLFNFLFAATGSNCSGNTPLFFRQSGVNATNTANFCAKMTLTPLCWQRPPLAPLAFRLNAVNAVLPKKCVHTKSECLLSKTHSHSTFYSTMSCVVLRAIFLRKIRKKRWRLVFENSSLNVMVLLMQWICHDHARIHKI